MDTPVLGDDSAYAGATRVISCLGLQNVREVESASFGCTFLVSLATPPLWQDLQRSKPSTNIRGLVAALWWHNMNHNKVFPLIAVTEAQ